MDEYMYTILYKKSVLSQEKKIFQYTPCYLIKGLYDKENNVFLDEINKERHLINTYNTDEEYFVGEVYSLSDVIRLYPEANNLEDALISLYKDAEMKNTLGVYNPKSKSMEIYEENLDYVTDQEAMPSSYIANNSISNNNYLPNTEIEIDEEARYISTADLNDIIYSDTLDEMHSKIKDIMNRTEAVYETDEDEASTSFLIGLDELENYLKIDDYDELRDNIAFLIARFEAFKEEINNNFIANIEDVEKIEDDDEKEDFTSIIDINEYIRKIESYNKKIEQETDFTKLKETLRDLIKFYEGGLTEIEMYNEDKKEKELLKTTQFLIVQTQCIFNILKKKDLNSMKRAYIALKNRTESNLELIRIEINPDGLMANLNLSRNKKDELINEKIEKAESKLNKLIGLENVKETMDGLFSTILFKSRTANNLEFESNNKHMVFMGNPGTGKTTVAEIVAPLFHELGYLKSSKISYAAAQDLIAEYVGQTALKTENLIKENKGGCIVVDEAYILAGKAQLFGNEAITVILKEMEKNETMFIFAGYKKEMQDFMKMNSGLKSRIGSYMEFKDYSEEELLEMFKGRIETTNKDKGQEHKLTITEDALEKVKSIIKEAREIKDFGNGRFIKNLFDNITIKHSKNTRNSTNEEDLYQITSDDVEDDVLDKIFFADNGNDLYSNSTMGFNKVLRK